MSDLCHFALTIVGTQKMQRSDSFGRGGVQSFFGCLRRAVPREGFLRRFSAFGSILSAIKVSKYLDPQVIALRVSQSEKEKSCPL